MNLGFFAGNRIAATGWFARLPIVGEEISFPVTEPNLADLLSMTLAGPLEELALVGIPLLLFGYRQGLAAFCTILMILRASFHIYYGISTTIGLLLWSGLALWMYTTTGRVLPLVLGHSVNNLLTFLILDESADSASSIIFKAAKAILIGVGVICALWVLRQWAARHQQATRPGGSVTSTATGATRKQTYPNVPYTHHARRTNARGSTQPKYSPTSRQTTGIRGHEHDLNC